MKSVGAFYCRSGNAEAATQVRANCLLYDNTQLVGRDYPTQHITRQKHIQNTENNYSRGYVGLELGR